jgi:hypothetical protein
MNLNLMNQPIWRGNACVGYSRKFLKPEVAELVLESVHPSNLGELPPSAEMLACKAKQVGLIYNIDEAFEVRRCGQFN